MANARLLRQYLEDYTRKADKANKSYKESYSTYKAGIDEHNAFLKQVKEVPGTAFVGDVGASAMVGYGMTHPWGIGSDIPRYEGPMYGAVYSYTDKNGAIAYKGVKTDDKGAIAEGSSQIFKSIEDAEKYYADRDAQLSGLGVHQVGQNLTGMGGWIKNPNSNTVSFYQSVPTRTYYVDKDGKEVEYNWNQISTPTWGGEGGESGSTVSWMNYKTGEQVYEDPAIAAGITQKQDFAWQKTDPAEYRTTEYLGPDAPKPDESIKPPTFTLGQIDEMNNPTDTPAQVEKAKGLGYSGNSKLVAEQAGDSANSAFTNLMGDDPRGLKDKGVLTRAIAGEL